MEDLGDLIGSMMVSLVRARRMADEETARLAEWYKENPLLEGLSVPRIRIPELTIDLPLLVEGSEKGEEAVLADKIAVTKAAVEQVKITAGKQNIKLSKEFNAEFNALLDQHVTKLYTGKAPVMRESVIRVIDQAFLEAQLATKTQFSSADKKRLSQDLRVAMHKASITREAVSPSIRSNILTSDVKEKSSKENVVRIRVTFKEEGLEWATSSSDSGGVKKTLQPE